MNVYVVVAWDNTNQPKRVAVFQSEHEANHWRLEVEQLGYTVKQYSRQVQ